MNKQHFNVYLPFFMAFPHGFRGQNHPYICLNHPHFNNPKDCKLVVTKRKTS